MKFSKVDTINLIDDSVPGYIAFLVFEKEYTLNDDENGGMKEIWRILGSIERDGDRKAGYRETIWGCAIFRK